MLESICNLTIRDFDGFVQNNTCTKILYGNFFANTVAEFYIDVIKDLEKPLKQVVCLNLITHA